MWKIIKHIESKRCRNINNVENRGKSGDYDFTWFGIMVYIHKIKSSLYVL